MLLSMLVAEASMLFRLFAGESCSVSENGVLEGSTTMAGLFISWFRSSDYIQHHSRESLKKITHLSIFLREKSFGSTA